MDTLARLRLDKENDMRESKDNHNQRWIAKVKISPYSIDLVAVRERALSEQKSKSSIQKSPSVDNDGRKGKAKNDVFSTALTEHSDLDALRREKRAILEEEQRLKALLVLEKTKNCSRELRMTAERAQKQRHLTKTEHRRFLNRDSSDAVITEESAALRRKLGR